MHWKIRRDLYLAPLCEKHGEEAALQAGFFFDEDVRDAPLDDVDWLCTPRPKRAITGSGPVVLLATGGFCPVHEGHLAMMERARAVAQRAGLEVIGGYLSPGHDAYLRMKCGPAAIPIQQRLRLCAEAVASSDWLSVDPWEALYRRVAVNYTDVVARLRAYLRAHVDDRIEVAYVCGADNARFSYAFSERGLCIVVGRPGAEAELERWRSRLGPHPNVLWADGDHAASSSALRTQPVPPRASPRLVVRLEDERAVRTLGLSSLREFQTELVAILSSYAQVRVAKLREPGPEANVISLDAILPARHNLAISRLFAPGGYETLGYVPRPGAAALSEQVAAIPPGAYTLRDDDCVTGETFAQVRALLPSHIEVTSTRVALEHAEDEDVLDARDFLLGADDGGLVLLLPDGQVGRAPYLLPYVDPCERASIAASHRFSIDLWRLNARIFASTRARVEDLPAASRATFRGRDMSLAELCEWHARRLEDFIA